MFTPVDVVTEQISSSYPSPSESSDPLDVWIAQSIEEDTSKFTADHQLRIIESIDAIRNPENLDQISQLIMLDHSSDFTQKLAVLQKSLDHAKNIKINNLDESKLAGNEIAKHIRELRLKAIESNQ